MATIRGAFGGGQIKGSLSGNVFQGSKAGTIMRNRSIPTNPRSPFQLLIRSALATVSNSWNIDLSDADRAGWNAYAAGTPLLDRFGELQHTSGRQMFIRTNSFAIYAGGPTFSTAPSSPGLVAPGSMTPVASVADGITFDGLLPPPATDEFMFIQVGQQRGPAVNYYNSPFQVLTTFTDATVFPFVVAPPLPLFEGNVLWFRWRRIGPDGKVSYANQVRVPVVA